MGSLSSPLFLKKMNRKGGERGQQTQPEDPNSEVEMVSRQSKQKWGNSHSKPNAYGHDHPKHHRPAGKGGQLRNRGQGYGKKSQGEDGHRGEGVRNQAC